MGTLGHAGLVYDVVCTVGGIMFILGCNVTSWVLLSNEHLGISLGGAYCRIILAEFLNVAGVAGSAHARMFMTCAKV